MLSVAEGGVLAPGGAAAARSDDAARARVFASRTAALLRLVAVVLAALVGALGHALLAGRAAGGSAPSRLGEALRGDRAAVPRLCVHGSFCCSILAGVAGRGAPVPGVRARSVVLLDDVGRGIAGHRATRARS